MGKGGAGGRDCQTAGAAQFLVRGRTFAFGAAVATGVAIYSASRQNFGVIGSAFAPGALSL
jgi:hypothetical protein